MKERFRITEWDLLNSLRLEERFTKLIGWRTGPIKKILQCGIEPGDPELFHVVLMHSSIERMVGLPTRVSLRAGGSGLNLADAFHRAVGEVVERYAIHFYDEDAVVFDSYANLTKQGLNVLAPDKLQFFSDAQLASEGTIFRRFTEDMRLGWAEGVSLITGKPILVPAQLLFFGYKFSPGEKRITYASSSGCACASSLEEALLKGIYESVERDAVMITWYAKLSPPAVDIYSSAYLRDLCESRGYLESGKSYNLRYISLDIDMPVIMGIAKITIGGKERMFVGASCNLDPEQAAFKALLEIGQGVPFVKQFLILDPFPSYEDMEFKDFNDNIRYYSDPEHIGNLDFLLESEEKISVHQLPNRYTGDIEEDLRTAVHILRERGLEPIAFDHTTEDMLELGFHVGRVLIPELMQLGTPSDPLLGNQRLYEVPVKLGLKTADMELNSDWHPFP